MGPNRLGDMQAWRISKTSTRQQSRHSSASKTSSTSSPSLLLWSLEFSDTIIYEPEIRALLGTASHFCEAVALRAVPLGTVLNLGVPTHCMHPAFRFLPKRAGRKGGSCIQGKIAPKVVRIGAVEVDAYDST